MIEPDADQVRDQLGRILRHRRLAGSAHLSRLLTYLVEETLQGRTAGLKELVLGRDVFGRGPAFDPRIDPIVRVQAAKLRARLKDYYTGDGSGDAVLIDLPRGAYIPVFSFRSAATVARPLSQRRRVAVTIGAAGLAVLAIVLWLVARRGSQPLQVLRQLTFDSGSTTFPVISRDGRLVAYSSDRAARGNLDIWVQRVDDSGRVRITTHEAADITPDLSPDASWVVYRSHRDGGGIYIASTLGGAERKLAGEAWRPRFSPDGRLIVYQGSSGRRRGGELFLMGPDGGVPRPIPIDIDLTINGGPVWTPDGKSILFAATEKREQDWWVIGVNGGVPQRTALREALRQLGMEWPSNTMPGDWRGGAHLFALTRGNVRSLWEVNLGARTGWKVEGTPRPLTFGTALEDSPRVSEAGRIVFNSESLQTQLWRLRLDAHGESHGPPEQLTNDASQIPGSSSYTPRFSVSSTLLAYATERSGRRSVRLQNLADGSERMITANAFFEDHPRLSRDGTRVACQGEREGRPTLRVEDLRSGTSREVNSECSVPEDWLPDDSSILCIGDEQHGIFKIDPATGRRAELLRGSGRFRQAAVSPDGKWLALVTDGGASFLVPLNRGTAGGRDSWKTITDDPSVESVHWALDGSRLFYFTLRDDFRCLAEQPIGRGTGASAGSPDFVRHFHSAHLLPWSTWIAADSTGLVVRLTEARSNVFLLER